MRREILCYDCNQNRLKHLGSPIIDTENGPRLAVPIGPTERHGMISNLLSETWFGVPENTSCWSIRGFAEAVELMDDLPEEIHGDE